MPIQGEPWRPGENEDALTGVLETLNKTFNRQSQLAQTRIHFLVDRVSTSQMHKVTATLDRLHSNDWQLLQLDWLLDGLKELSAQNQLQDVDWVAGNLLPLLNPLTPPSLQTKEGALPEEDSQEKDVDKVGLEEKQEERFRQQQLEEQLREQQQLKGQIKQLQQAKNQLEQQLQSLNRLDLEQLVTLLPALYKNFWSTIRPDELAMLSGHLQVPSIPSPYPEPSAGVLQKLKRRIKNLPEHERRRLIDFCRDLPQRLTPRPDMQHFFEEWQDE